MFKWKRQKTQPASSRELKQTDLKYLNDLSAAMQKEHHMGLLMVLALLLAFIATFVIWASLSQVDEVTRGQGRVIPQSREQLIQSLDPGVLSEMLVKEGDIVEKGQPLLKLDDTRSSAQYREGLAKLQALQAAATRLRAEAYGTALAFDAGIPKELRERESTAYSSRRKAMEDSVRGLRQSKALLDREIEITSPMVAKGVMSEVELLRSKRQSNDLEIQVNDRINKYRADADSDLQRVEADLSQAVENNIMRADPVNRAIVRSPLRGIIKNIKINTIGGVIGVGQDIMEIVPLDEENLVEAYILPKDVAFVAPDMNALVKLSAYDYSLYGGLEGKVKLISPDTLQDDKRPSELNLDPNNSYYRVIIKINPGEKLTDKNGQVLLPKPGMFATVDIKTGHKSVLRYITKPITRLKSALSER